MDENNNNNNNKEWEKIAIKISVKYLYPECIKNS